jgi:glycosyltransferase involved in cell wall biosynthesis/GT2 family glycosyltransferase
MDAVSDRPEPPDRALRICFVTREYPGYHTCGGIGTAVAAWARAAAAAGHAVTVLLTHEAPDRALDAAVSDGAGGPVVAPLPPADPPVLGSQLVGTAYRVFTTLAARDFDIVCFHDWLGQGMYALSAKRQGLAFARTLLCVVAHGSTAWTWKANRRFPQDVAELEAAFLERQSVALADVLLSPNRYMRSWMRGQGWELPAKTLVLPYLIDLPGDGRRCEKTRPGLPTELVFFGRLEQRKGVTLFCDALERLCREGHAGFSVTFLGSESRVGEDAAGDYLRRRGRDWPFAWRILGDLDRDAALAHLQQGGCLAVMPSLCDNSPNTVHECMAAAIPFLAADVGGIAESVAPEDRERVLFAPNAAALAGKLAAALAQGVAPARPAVSPEVARREWLGWLDGAARESSRLAPAAAGAAALPLPRVSVCLVHHDRPHLLRAALESLRAQDYPDFEVVLVDDGSVLPQAQALLRELEAEFHVRDWILARQDNRYLGAARNAAAALSRGAYLLFMDDDNLARPQEISTFVRAALAGGADILTCVASMFDGAEPAGESVRGLYVPLGGALAPGFYANVFGDANALVKKDVFAALGGFSEERDLGFEDWEFFARAVLAGYALQVVPVALFDYHTSVTGMLGTTDSHRNACRALRPFLERVPGELAPALLLGREAATRLDASRQEIRELRQELAQAQARQTAPVATSAPPPAAEKMAQEAGAPAGPALLPCLLRRVVRDLPARGLMRLRREREARLVRASRAFDAAWYLARNPDVAAAGYDPALHYLVHGACEGRDPGPGFDTRFYLAANADVAAAGINPLVHYLRHGRSEGRPGLPPQPAVATPVPAQGDGRPLVVCPACDWAVSGVHTLTERVGLALRRRGWDFRILFTAPREQVLQSAGGRLPQVPHTFLPIAHLPDPAYTEALVGFFAEKKPCVFLCGCDFRANAAAARLPSGVGLVVVAHADEQVYYEQAAALGPHCHAVVCVSTALAHAVAALPGLAARTAHIAHSGLGADDIRLRTGMGAPAVSCIYTGRLIAQQKRILDFIALARCLDATGRPYRLSLVGQDFGGAEAVLRRELAGQIAHGSVRLPGRLEREALLAELDRHHFFVLLSEYEGFSLSLAEAMGRGCVPLVAKVASGNGDLVVAGKNGMVMPHRDYGQWADWLVAQSEDAAGWLALSRAASETVRASYTLEGQIDRIDALLRACLAQAEAG